MSKKDKVAIICDITNSSANDDAILKAVRLILDYKGDELELGELPENIEFVGEDNNGNGIYKIK